MAEVVCVKRLVFGISSPFVRDSTSRLDSRAAQTAPSPLVSRPFFPFDWRPNDSLAQGSLLPTLALLIAYPIAGESWRRSTG